MTHQTLERPAGAPRKERGLGYALLGGLGVTLLALLVGGALLAWLLAAQSDTGPPDLLPADTQLYIGLPPILSDVPEPARVAGVLNESLGISDSAALIDGVEGRLGVDIRDDVVTWLGSQMAVAVRGLDPQAIQGPDIDQRLLESADVLILLGSRNDPQATIFLNKHLEVRRNRGDRVAEIQAGDTTVYVSEGAPPSPLAAVALIDHNLVFANRADILVEMANNVRAADRLASLPAFEAFREELTPRDSSGLYTDGTPAAEAARSALREVILSLGE